MFSKFLLLVPLALPAFSTPASALQKRTLVGPIACQPDGGFTLCQKFLGNQKRRWLAELDAHLG
jgi:hypothetical protein